jgi:hypothetical protein
VKQAARQAARQRGLLLLLLGVGVAVLLLLHLLLLLLLLVVMRQVLISWVRLRLRALVVMRLRMVLLMVWWAMNMRRTRIGRGPGGDDVVLNGVCVLSTDFRVCNYGCGRPGL